MSKRSPFKSTGIQKEFFAAYDGVLKLWPVPYEELLLSSRFGETHVVISGPENAPPLVLLHGFMNTLMMWLPNVEALARKHRVYAIDTMGHPSRSVPDEPIRNPHEFSEWLTSTLGGLGLDRVSLAGISHGGWIALNFAIASPSEVSKLILVAPAASFQPIRKRFLARTMASFLPPRHSRFTSMMKWMGLEDTPEDPYSGPLLELIWLGGTHFRMSPQARRVMGSVFSDDQLSALPMPVLLLVGESEVIYDPAKAKARAEEHIPNLTAAMIPRGRHAMSVNHAQEVNARILDFLGTDHESPPT